MAGVGKCDEVAELVQLHPGIIDSSYPNKRCDLFCLWTAAS
jgi:hypothetical protein